MKRIFDLLLAIALIIPTTMIVLMAAIAVRCETSGPPVFTQTRIGRGKRPFKLIKLRTMHVGTTLGASHLVGDATVTRVGRVLRKTKIDELPQIWSVILGEMSFVGPRPCLPIQEELIAARDRLGVFALRPGITGKAQVMGIDMSDPERLAIVDAEYLHSNGLASDLLLIIGTITGSGYYDAADSRRL